MALHPPSGISLNRVDRLSETQLRTGGQSQRQAVAPQAAHRSARMDQAGFSPEALAMNRLVRMWGAVTGLFGTGQAGRVPDLSALREALMQARKNAEAVELRQNVTDTLKSSALRQAELLVEKYYGLKGDGTKVNVSYSNNTEGALASVSFQYDNRGRIVNPRLNINLGQFSPDTSSNGVNDHIIQNDRIVAHEVTHLIMGRNMDMASLPDWFAEGTAEYISGGAERVALSLRHQSPQRLLSSLNKPWAGDSDSYAAGYLAVRFLDQATAGNGGLKAIMGQLKEGDSLDEAISAVSQARFRDTADFLKQFTTEGAGLAFMRSIDLSGRDAGAIKPGPGRSVVADDRSRSAEPPMRGFQIQWPSPLEGLV
ncbi:MAG TPA: flagellinolysin [Symbiobacteriaceae bacterium]|nr:flagellinolysin [Symbiobacteriaceae bacterium]